MRKSESVLIWIDGGSAAIRPNTCELLRFAVFVLTMRLKVLNTVRQILPRIALVCAHVFMLSINTPRT